MLSKQIYKLALFPPCCVNEGVPEGVLQAERESLFIGRPLFSGLFCSSGNGEQLEFRNDAVGPLGCDQAPAREPL